ncbi:hypothetical protein ABES25_01685 [Bacillus gobiensis]|uniref:hypothetical protein n=1 Tax=Bacillus gobiensis TaxID=1441095 RepID=UPI003D1F4475
MSMKKGKALFLMILVVLCLSACSKNMTFSGESENWTAEFFLFQHNEMEDANIVLRYKGEEEINSIGPFEYKAESIGYGFARGGAELNKEGVFEDSEGPSERTTPENEEIETTVKWKWKTEKIILTLKD